VISQKLIDSVRSSDKKAYQIAQEAGLHFSTISQIINKIVNVKQGDQRVIAIGRVLGINPEDCFEDKKPDPWNTPL
jgi:hypothetical protein